MAPETLHVDERLVVSPAAGLFSPADPVPDAVDVGTAIGWVSGGGRTVPVVSAFRGRLVAVTAVAGERVARSQRVAWLRAW